MSSFISTISTTTGYTSLIGLDLYDCQLYDDFLISLSNQFLFQHHHHHTTTTTAMNNNNSHCRCSFPNLNTLDLDGKQNFSLNCIETKFVPALRQTIELEYVSIKVDSLTIRAEIQLICDVNRAGRRYLLKMEEEQEGTKRIYYDYYHHHHKHPYGQGKKQQQQKQEQYPVSLWPLILKRINHTMKLYQPKYWDSISKILQNQDRRQRATSVMYFLLLNGALIDMLQ